MSRPTEAASEPWGVVQRLNAAWRTNQFAALPALFHERAVIVDNLHRRLAVGRTACVESYRAFVTSASVDAYVEGAPTVDLFEDCATVTYPFEMQYTTGGQTYTEAGSDCLLLERSADGWRVVWRQLVSGAA